MIGTADDVRALPSDTRSVRCIACDDATLGAVATRSTRLEYVFANETATLTDRGIEALAALPRRSPSRHPERQQAHRRERDRTGVAPRSRNSPSRTHRTYQVRASAGSRNEQVVAAYSPGELRWG